MGRKRNSPDGIPLPSGKYQVQVVLEKEERDDIFARAALRGISVQAYVRNAICEFKRKEDVDIAVWEILKAHAETIAGERANQLVKNDERLVGTVEN